MTNDLQDAFQHPSNPQNAWKIGLPTPFQHPSQRYSNTLPTGCAPNPHTPMGVGRRPLAGSAGSTPGLRGPTLQLFGQTENRFANESDFLDMVR